MPTTAYAQQRTIVNPSFEIYTPPSAAPPTAPPNFVITSDSVSPGWISTDGSMEFWASGFQSTPASDGNFLIELNPDAPIGLYQEVCLVNGETLSWSFDHRARSGGADPQTTVYEVRTTGDVLVQSLATQATAIGAGWQTNSGSTTFTGATGTYRLQFRTTDPGSVGNHLDNVQITLIALSEMSASATSDNENAASPSLPQLVVNGTVASNTTVPVTVTGGTATAGVDFTQTAAFITVPAGMYDGVSAGSFFTVPITITDDELLEGDETIELTLGAPSTSSIVIASPDCVSSPETTTTHTIIDEDVSGVAVSKSANTSALSSPPLAGETISYAFTVTNTGSVTLTNVTLSDPDAAVTGGPIASLAGGASDSVTFTGSRLLTQADIDSGSFTNQATVSATDPSSNTVTDLSDDPADPTDNDTEGDNEPDDPTVVTLAAGPQMVITKTASLVKLPGNTHPDAEVGDTINYTYDVDNTGNITITDVEVADIHGGTGAFGDPGHTLLTDNGTPGDSPDTNADPTIWGTLAPGDRIRFTASYTVTQQDQDTLQ